MTSFETESTPDEHFELVDVHAELGGGVPDRHDADPYQNKPNADSSTIETIRVEQAKGERARLAAEADEPPTLF